MAIGKVLQFDPSRGYGFIAAEDGGEDVFLHASVFDGDPGELIPGTPLEFQIMAGDRGRKAYAARFAEENSAPQEKVFVPQQTLVPHQASATIEDEQMCDVLSQAEFGAELTELLLNTVPPLTGTQILAVRQGLADFAATRGWVDA